MNVALEYAFGIDAENTHLKLGLVTLAHLSEGKREVEINLAEFQRLCCYSTRREAEIAIDWIPHSGFAKVVDRDLRTGTVTLRLLMGGG